MGRPLTAGMRILCCAVVLLAGVIVSGCAGDKAAAVPTGGAQGAGATTKDKTNYIVTPDAGLDGKVSNVNSNLRFVVLTFPVGQMPNLNQHLFVYRKNLKVGEVRVTGPQQDDSIVADVTIGEAAIGDEVRDK